MQHSDRTIPPLVEKAQRLADTVGFASSSRPSTGRLLRLLTSLFPHGRIGETGSGCGVGAAWVVSGLADSASFITVERDTERATAVARLFEPYRNVRVLADDWRAVLPFGPFDLLFADGGPQLKGAPDGLRQIARDDVDLVLGALRLGGLLVLDDLGPEEDWPAGWRGKSDPALAFWLHEPRVVAAPLIAGFERSPSNGMLLATRLR
jgi:predicted O-methyltransferase YrrM